ncbi:MAG: molybdopterin-dependent oxidoreductase [Acidobacteria bacterium]|nr:molybdopterin-dependent oxidoreductase [Acidobacteriota bacterium]
MSNSDDESTWGRSKVETVCSLDCPDTCSLEVTLEKGRIVAIDGSDRHAVTDGYICEKVRRFGDRVYGDTRVPHPLIREGTRGEGRFRRASWDEALGTIATRMIEIRDQWGAEAILPFSYGGSNGLLTQDTADARLFRQFGTSRLARTVCAIPTSTANQALYGKMAGVTYPDYQHARLIVVWGANPSSSGIHLVPHIKTAQKAGAALVVIDPRRTNLARQADIHLALAPGTDVVVALSIHRYLFEHDLADQQFLAEHTHGAEQLRERAAEWTFDRAAEVAGLDAELLENFAEMYAAISPAVLRCGWGLERNRNGGNAALAVLALPTVAGKFGVRGGGYSMSNSGAWNLSPDTWIDTPEPDTRIVNMNLLGRVLLEYRDPPIQMLFVYNCNPVATMPNQNRVLEGLARDDLFTVVFEQVMTDTAQLADVVLPATTFLESYDVAKSYGLSNLQLVRPVIDAVEEARPNVEVFAELATRLGLDVGQDQATDAEALVHLTNTLPEEIRQPLMETGIVTGAGDGTPIQFVDVFPDTPDGKVQLFPEELERESPAGLYRYREDPATRDYPLTLISPATEKTISSTLGELRTGVARLQMHPDDAGARELSTGDTVRIFNALGEVHCPVTLNADMRRGTVGLPKGLWRMSTFNGSTANALVSDELTDIGGGAVFNDARVEVARVMTARFDNQHLAFWTTDPVDQVH